MQQQKKKPFNQSQKIIVFQDRLDILLEMKISGVVEQI
jgi:hypothetical protein